jgi:ABC-2 type transport system ATP-binding protein
VPAVTSSPPVLSATGLDVGFGAPVCPPVDLELHAGQVLAVVGSNGVGKSTLLRTLAGRQAPLAGELLLFGAPVDDRSQEFRASVAVDLGDDVFIPALTVTEHLLMVGYGHGVADAEGVTAAMLDDFGLAERADALPSALSSGQRRRLLLAGVFVRPRALMLLDEPEQRLDGAMRQILADRLNQEAAAGGSVLLATHDPELVRRACSDVLALADDAVRRMSPEEGARYIGSQL